MPEPVFRIEMLPARQGDALWIEYGAPDDPARVLIDAGYFAPEDMTLAALKTWLAADPARGRKTMQKNRSFVFFRELANEDDGPLGSLEIPLSDGRSLAVDTGFHALGTPVYVSAPTLEP